jgi:hypothetical protein
MNGGAGPSPSGADLALWLAERRPIPIAKNKTELDRHSGEHPILPGPDALLRLLP